MSNTETLSDWVIPDDYRAPRAHIFPSPSSWEWFARRNRDRLLKAGAISRPAGRTLVHPGRCDQVVLEVGQETAAAKA